MSEINVNTIDKATGSTLNVGAAGTTVNIAGTAGTGFPTPTTGIAASAITTGTLADARIPNLNASKITAGTISTARLGSGTASSSTFLRGDQTYAAAGGGKVLQVITHNLASNHTMSSGTTTDVTGMTPSITMASATNKLLVLCGMSVRLGGNGATVTPSSNTFITDSSNNYKAGQYWYFNVASNGHHPTISCYMQALWTPGASGSYQVKLRTNNASEGGYVQFYAQNGGASSLTTSFTLIELDA